ncbi:hypothetical protein ABK040_012392 [Willaertia magna]
MPQHLLSLISDCQGTTLENEMDPLKNLTIKSIKSIGINSIMLLTDNGLLFGYGNNGSGELGLGKEITSTKEFTQIPNLAYKTKLIECGYDSTYMIDELNQLYFTGIAIVLSEDEEQQFTFTKIEKFNENIKLIRVAFDVIFIVTENNLMYVRGKNDGGQLGLGHKNPVFNSFVKNNSLQHVKIKDLKCADFHSIILDDNGIVYYCGQYYDTNNNDNNDNEVENSDNFYFKPFDFVHSKIRSISATYKYSILYSHNNELIIVNHYNTLIDHIVLNLPSGMKLNSLFGDNLGSEFFSAFITKENKIYTHKNNGGLSFDYESQVGDYALLTYSNLSNNNTLPYLKIIGMDYSDMYVIYTDYLINENVGDNKNLNLFFVKLKNQLFDYKNSFIDIHFAIC